MIVHVRLRQGGAPLTLPRLGGQVEQHGEYVVFVRAEGVGEHHGHVAVGLAPGLLRVPLIQLRRRAMHR